ncbi:MAG TPA: AI-2E family transporter, partial [Terracidiphilus sp.]|nr:AI-2E family transporter [Terracidiphilus sp.]
MRDPFEADRYLGISKEFRGKIVFSAAVLAAAAAMLVLLWLARYVLLLLFAGFVGALVLSTLASWISTKLHMQRRLAFLLVVTALFVFAGLLIWFRGPVLADQIFDLQKDIPASIDRIHARLDAQDWGRWLLSHTNGSDQIARGLGFLVSGIGGAMYLTGATLGGLFIVFISSLYLAFEPEAYVRGFERLLPPSVRETANACLQEVVLTLKRWLLAKAISMAMIAVFVALGLLLLQVPLAGTLGIIAGLLTFIPNLGPFLSAVPAALLAFGISPGKGFLTLGLFCLAHFLEGNLVTPLAERKIARLPPALTLTV